MDWREFPHLKQRTQLRPPDLPVLPPISDRLPELSRLFIWTWMRGIEGMGFFARMCYNPNELR
jgi:hypothetical protein